jgi:hypothetical protein
MSLADGQWLRVSIHTMALEYLRAERDTHLATVRVHLPSLISDADLDRLLENADLSNPLHNHSRLRLLYLMRNVYIGEIPPDTEWYEVHSLTDQDLHNLYVTRYDTWTDQSDNNELGLVAARREEPAKTAPDQWKRVILWGHEKAGPFTIIEGNHRLVGYVANKSGGLNIPVLIGLSPTPCYWHPLDPPGILMADLWAKAPEK